MAGPMLYGPMLAFAIAIALVSFALAMNALDGPVRSSTHKAGIAVLFITGVTLIGIAATGLALG